MGAGLGPYLHQDNLKFGIDTGHNVLDNGYGNRYYAGEPTTNLIPNSPNNGRFTTSNNWATYNTNQYNSNTYFSIGTIGSVTDNIVTLSSVGRTIRSFDVLRPQTTGGGVTAGTDYVIKKLSSNTFSLHAYNSSQNGSQGYTNPTTQFFKVHDAYALDQRVSINATSFPTMWWGAPHLPNSGLIKEIVEGGGRVPGTNCMRLHVYRGDGVADGMAYGVNTPVTAGDTITVSYWQRTATSNIAGKYLGYSTYFGPGYGAGSGGFTSTTTNEWEFVSHQWTASNTYSFISYFWPQGSSDIYAIDICDMQVEVNKGHATPFVAGTRSSTESLKDVARNATVDVTNVSFNADNLVTYDGTDDYMTVSLTDVNLDSGCTIEGVLKRNSTPTAWRTFFNIKPSGANTPFFEFRSNANTQHIYADYYNGTDYVTNAASFTTGTYAHVVASYDGNGNISFYFNGSLVHTKTGVPSFQLGTSPRLTIGRAYSNDRYTDIEAPVVRVYSEALTAADVSKNYRAYKERLSLS